MKLTRNVRVVVSTRTFDVDTHMCVRCNCNAISGMQYHVNVKIITTFIMHCVSLMSRQFSKPIFETNLFLITVN